MTLPNKLTIARIAAIPAMLIIACIPYLKQNTIFCSVSLANFINLLIFVAAAVTDFFDGKIARKHNLVTTFGKFADPLADKILVLTSFLILMEQGYTLNIGSLVLKTVPMWGVAIILLRELTVSGVRLVAAQKGEVIAAGMSGKVKTFETMVALLFLFLAGTNKVLDIIALVGMYVSIILTVYSGIVYLYNSRKIIFESI